MALTAKERDELLEKIHEQTVKTNGRVNQLWETTYGDPSKQITGIVSKVRDHDRYISDQSAIGRAVKIVLPFLTVANLGVLAKVLGYLG